MDCIRITITTGCEPDGTGGAVLDSAGAVLPDGMANTIAAAFAAAFGTYQYPDLETGEMVTADPHRNTLYCVRKFITDIVRGHVAQQAAQQAAQVASQQVDTILSATQIID